MVVHGTKRALPPRMKDAIVMMAQSPVASVRKRSNIAATCGVSLREVYYVLRLYRDIGSTTRKHLGRRRSLDVFDMMVSILCAREPLVGSYHNSISRAFWNGGQTYIWWSYSTSCLLIGTLTSIYQQFCVLLMHMVGRTRRSVLLLCLECLVTLSDY